MSRPSRSLTRAGAATLALATAFGMIATVELPAASADQPAANLALQENGGSVTASGQEVNGQWGPELVIDGINDPSSPKAQQSRWSSNTADDAQVTVMLAAPAIIDHVAIQWESACAAKYKIQVSSNGTDFIDATDVISPNCGTRDTQQLTKLDGATAYQYVRMQGIERTPIGGQKYGISLWEFEVWDGPEPVAVESPQDRLVPLPQNVAADSTAAPFVLSEKTRIVAPAALDNTAEFLANLLRTSTGFSIPVVSDAAAEGDIELTVGEVTGYEGAEEAYALTTSADRVKITAPTDHGAFNAAQTLRQLLPALVESDTPVVTAWNVPAVTITDAPRFSHRGTMLDVARSFLTVDEVKAFLDGMAQHKLSTMHFHIADDQGWRIEITNDGKESGDPIDYSLLTERSGATAMTQAGYQGELGRTGYYTQEEYKEIIAYAAKLHIDVVPEIDTPGHTNAALHAIEELNTAGAKPAADESGRVPANGTGNVGYSTLDANADITWTFMRHVLGQLAAITPGEYLHVGGDESHVTSHDNYVKFITKSVEIVHSLDKKMIGWNESSVGGVKADDAIQYWTGGTADTLTAIKEKGAKLIASRGDRAYLDMKYNGKTPIGLTWAGTGDFPVYYDWDPAAVVKDGDENLPDEAILGVEGPMWAETIRGGEQAEFLAFPRTISHAEIGWTEQDKRDVTDFTKRMASVGERLLAGGTNFYDGAATNWKWSAAGAQLKIAPKKPLTLSVGTVTAPGTKAAENGVSIAVDNVNDDDGVSASSVQGTLTASIDWGDGSEPTPATFRTDAQRSVLSAGGLYTLQAEHEYTAAGDYVGTITFSDGTLAAFTATVAAGTPDPVAPVSPWDPASTPALTVEATVDAGERLPGTLAGFEPGSYVTISLGDTVLGTVRPGPDGTLPLSLPVVPATYSGDYTVTATAGDRTATANVKVSSHAIALENRIDHELLSIESVTSEETAGENAPATKAIDGKPDTFWHTKWQGDAGVYPHSITIDLGDKYDVSGFAYQQRAGNTNGRMKDFELFVSDDPKKPGEPVATGSFKDFEREQVIVLDKTVQGRYVTLKGLNSISGNGFGGAAEISIGGTLVEDETPPVVEPAVVLGASSVAAGADVTLNATGLAPDTATSVMLEPASGNTDEGGAGGADADGLAKAARAGSITIADDLATDDEGALTATITLPASLEPGAYSLVVLQGDNDARAAAPLTVTAASSGGDTDPGDGADPDNGANPDEGADPDNGANPDEGANPDNGTDVKDAATPNGTNGTASGLATTGGASAFGGVLLAALLGVTGVTFLLRRRAKRGAEALSEPGA